MDEGEKRRRTELQISGMTCASCAAAVEEALMEVEGVGEARVNLGKETAVVEVDPSKAKLVDLERAVSDAGYSVVDERVALKVGGMICVRT